MRIAGLHLRSEQRPRQSLASFIFAKLLEAAARTDGIDVPLRKNGAEPGLQRTAPMKVTKERTFRAFAAGQSVQLGKKGIREITSFRGTRVAVKNRGRRRAQVSAVLGEKMLPSRLTSFGASGGQSQIFKMQRAEIFFELKRSKGCTRQTLRCAAFQCDREMPTREPPACSIGLRVKPLDQGGAVLQRLHRVYGICVSRRAFWIFGHVYSGVHCIPRNPASGYNAALAALKDNPAEGNSRAKRAKKGDATQREFRVSYFSVAHPARNENCLAGLEVGALRRARRSISDFATLVRKSYSGSPSLVSTLVLVEHFLLCWRTWEH